MTSPIDYVARGWQIFPCHSIERGRCTCKLGAACENSGKHPLTQHGFYDASTDTNLINGWRARWPNANWALRTGATTGLAVIDIDPRNGGYQTIQALEQQRGPLPDTLKSTTGGGGRHLFYLIPPGLEMPKVRGWMPGIDVQAEGGYVILPEGKHKSGTEYRWVNWDTQPPTPLPPDIATMLMNRPQSARAGSNGDLGDTETILQGVPEGERDDTLFRWACRLRRQLGDGGRRIVELAVLEAAARCSPPFPPEQALRKVEQAWQQDHSDSFIDWARSWDEQGEAEAPRLNLKRGSEIRNRERPEMLIENVLPPGALSRSSARPASTSRSWCYP